MSLAGLAAFSDAAASGFAAGEQRYGSAGKPHAPDAQERAARDMNIAK